LLNSLVAIVGWMLWKAGWIRITHPAWWRTVLDVMIFLGAMDFGMYVFHRLAHHPWVYPWIHARHHTHESVNALSLFVLNPFEVLGFGALMIAVMMLVPLSGAAVLIYLTLNVFFGTLGHAGVEPFPESWQRRLLLREIGSSSFHAGHHRTPTTNYGFYTLVWDRLFGTLAK
jgi:Delta7-sterol 5-desaturase